MSPLPIDTDRASYPAGPASRLPRHNLRTSPQPLFLALMLAASPATANAAQQTCLDNAGNQQEINQCSGMENQAADRELNNVYQAVLLQHGGDKAFIDHLKQAQRAWLKWRDAELLAIYPEREPGYYGSGFNACWNRQAASLTRERTRQLQKWLDGVEEGDVCAGSYPIKPTPPELPEGRTSP
ncbi:MAG: DUF1311 domain-containing protein [Methylomonas sp.]|nr:DUF1311 domain-containing protein [Methylomonas sp.]